MCFDDFDVFHKNEKWEKKTKTKTNTKVQWGHQQVKRSWPMSYPNNVCKHFHRFSPTHPFYHEFTFVEATSLVHWSHMPCQAFFWPIDPACGPPSPPKRVPGSNCRTHTGPDLSEQEKETLLRVPRKRGKLLKRWGWWWVKYWFSLSPVGFDPHPCQVDSESGILPTVQRAHPICKLSQGRHSNPPHLHVKGLNRSQIFRTRMQSASEFCVHSNSLSLSLSLWGLLGKSRALWDSN